jgi:hypothetical protein
MLKIVLERADTVTGLPATESEEQIVRRLGGLGVVQEHHSLLGDGGVRQNAVQRRLLDEDARRRRRGRVLRAREQRLDGRVVAALPQRRDRGRHLRDHGPERVHHVGRLEPRWSPPRGAPLVAHLKGNIRFSHCQLSSLIATIILCVQQKVLY